MGKKFYLAGPFFNVVQKAHALKILARVRLFYPDVYAPVEHGVAVDGEEKAVKVFDENVRELLACDVLLAQIDWLNPLEQEVRLVKPYFMQPQPIKDMQHRGECIVSTTFQSPPLNIPDTGTVWEMGFAKALQIIKAVDDGESPRPLIVAYSVSEQGAVNLMLTRSCDGYLSGWEELEAFVQSGELTDGQEKWSGEYL